MLQLLLHKISSINFTIKFHLKSTDHVSKICCLWLKRGMPTLDIVWVKMEFDYMTWKTEISQENNLTVSTNITLSLGNENVLLIHRHHRKQIVEGDKRVDVKTWPG